MDIREAYQLFFMLEDDISDCHSDKGHKCKAVNLDAPNAPALTGLGVSRAGLYGAMSYNGQVRDYTKRVSSYLGERLDAFIGVSGQFEPKTSLVSRIALSGLSDDNFVESLTWYSPAPQYYDVITALSHDNRKPRMLPSWSWVSLSGPVSISAGAMRRKCEVKNEANILCNLAGTPWTVEPSFCERTRILCVTLHLWTALIRCTFVQSILSKRDDAEIYTSKPGDAQSSTVYETFLI
jgi:hypothetical protein